MRTALTLAGLALVLGGAVGCGGDDSGDDSGDNSGDVGASSPMPTNASKEEFCGNFASLAGDLGKLDPTTGAQAALRALRDAVDSMRETGTPEGIPDDARHGLEVTLAAIDDLPEDATVGDVGNLADSLSEQEKADSDAFGDYLQDQCGSLE